jgi:hypothetical protein
MHFNGLFNQKALIFITQTKYHGFIKRHINQLRYRVLFFPAFKALLILEQAQIL